MEIGFSSRLLRGNFHKFFSELMLDFLAALEIFSGLILDLLHTLLHWGLASAVSCCFVEAFSELTLDWPQTKQQWGSVDH